MRGEKLQNRPLSKLNTGRLALRAMLPVIKLKPKLTVMCVRVTVHSCHTIHNGTVLAILPLILYRIVIAEMLPAGG